MATVGRQIHPCYEQKRTPVDYGMRVGAWRVTRDSAGCRHPFGRFLSVHSVLFGGPISARDQALPYCKFYR